MRISFRKCGDYSAKLHMAFGNTSFAMRAVWPAFAFDCSSGPTPRGPERTESPIAKPHLMTESIEDENRLR